MMEKAQGMKADNSKNGSIMPSNGISRQIKVVDDLGNPLPDVEFGRIIEVVDMPPDNQQIISLGLTDEDGLIMITANPNAKILVTHVSGESFQSKFSELDEVITFEPNQLDEVVITTESRLAGLVTVSGLLLAGASKFINKKKNNKN